MAGGIAHDFNNLLTPIMGYGQLGAKMLPEHHPTRQNFLEINKAAGRAANLVRQLLAFSRQQVAEPTIFCPNSMISDMRPLLRRLIGEDISLITQQDEGLGAVRADQGQLGQVLMNLVVNSRDAMPGGGKITISTYNIGTGHTSLASSVNTEDSEPPPGEHVVLAVTDEGPGIPEDVRPHIFEPFFTTKDVDQGTGLGLATCYGIIAQSGGCIRVDSGEGPGTTIRVYLPLLEQVDDDEPESIEESISATSGAETVLLVEDEDLVRGITSLVLREQGYTVLEAKNGEEGLTHLREHGSGDIDLLLTDIVMPRMSGTELARLATADFPELRVLYVSGYTEDRSVGEGMADREVPFLTKPFSPVELVSKVRELLDARLLV